MANTWIVEGVLRDGLRVAAGFTELPWVRAQFVAKLGLEIIPGTVNLEVRDAAGLAVLARLRTASGVPIEPPGPPSRGELDGAPGGPSLAPARGEAGSAAGPPPGWGETGAALTAPQDRGTTGAAPVDAEAAPGAAPDAAPFCVGQCFHARIGGLAAAVVVPHVPDYPPDKLELIAAVHVRDALGLASGDRVTVTIEVMSDE